MEQPKMLFSAVISKNGNRPWYDYILNWVAIIVFWLLYVMFTNNDSLFLEILPWVLIFSYSLGFYYVTRFIYTGTILVFNDHIEVRSKQLNKDFELDQLKNLSIIRKSNFHNRDIGDEELEGGNVLSLTWKGKKYKFYFLIESLERNQLFEDMISELYKLNVNLDYRSV